MSIYIPRSRWEPVSRRDEVEHDRPHVTVIGRVRLELAEMGLPPGIHPPGAITATVEDLYGDSHEGVPMRLVHVLEIRNKDGVIYGPPSYEFEMIEVEPDGFPDMLASPGPSAV